MIGDHRSASKPAHYNLCVRRVPQATHGDWVEAGVAVSSQQVEKRDQGRIRIEVTASITAGYHTIAGSVKDLSGRGLFLFTDARLQVGKQVDVLMVLPEDLELPLSGMVYCHGRVVRSHFSDGQYGVAVRFDRFEPLRQM